MLPPTIPLFPLPNVVLFPNVFLPLHIFEPRYRAMVADAIRGDRLIGMVLLRPGWEDDYLGRPPVYPIGCAGLITHVDTLDDGRYNLILRGLEKFRILAEIANDETRVPGPGSGAQTSRAGSLEHEASSEVTDWLYRRARIEPLDETVPAAARDRIRESRTRLEALLATDLPRISSATMSDEDLVNALAQYLDLEPVEKQALLERDGLPARCQSLIDLLEMKMISARHKASVGRAH